MLNQFGWNGKWLAKVWRLMIESLMVFWCWKFVTIEWITTHFVTISLKTHIDSLWGDALPLPKGFLKRYFQKKHKRTTLFWIFFVHIFSSQTNWGLFNIWCFWNILGKKLTNHTKNKRNQKFWNFQKHFISFFFWTFQFFIQNIWKTTNVERMYMKNRQKRLVRPYLVEVSHKKFP